MKNWEEKKTNTMLVYVDSFLPSAASLTQVCDSSYLQPGRHVVWCLSVVCVLVLFAIWAVLQLCVYLCCLRFVLCSAEKMDHNAVRHRAYSTSSCIGIPAWSIGIGWWSIVDSCWQLLKSPKPKDYVYSIFTHGRAATRQNWQFVGARFHLLRASC